MGLKTMSLLAGATISASGGTAQVFADDGITIQNGLHLIVPADTDYTIRRTATCKYRAPALNATTGAYGKDKKSISYTFPKVVDGKVVFNVLRLEREVHPSVTAAECLEMNKIGSQLLTDADVADFWANGSMS